MAKSIKFKNNNFLDSTGIVHNKKTLKDLIPRFFYHHDQVSEKDLNAILAPGIYQLGYNYTNSPEPGTAIYGILVILTSRYYLWEASDNSNWIHQIIFKTDGKIYIRNAVNTNTFTAWTSLNDSGTYLISDAINRTSGDIDLCDSINNYDYLICAVGAVGEGAYVHTQMMPFTSQYVKGKKIRGEWRINTDIPVALTANGSKITFEIPNETTLRIKSNTSNTPVRGIYGVKL